MQRLHNGYAKSIEQMTGRYLQSQRSDNKSSSTNEQLSFQEVLHEAAEIKQDAVPDLKFSKHAGERLIARNINLSRCSVWQQEPRRHEKKELESLWCW